MVFEFFGKLIIGAVLGLIVYGVTETYSGGGRVKPGSQKEKDIKKNVKENLSNGPISSKEELQEWWDTHHPSK